MPNIQLEVVAGGPAQRDLTHGMPSRCSRRVGAAGAFGPANYSAAARPGDTSVCQALLQLQQLEGVSHNAHHHCRCPCCSYHSSEHSDETISLQRVTCVTCMSDQQKILYQTACSHFSGSSTVLEAFKLFHFVCRLQLLISAYFAPSGQLLSIRQSCLCYRAQQSDASNVVAALD
jgi:hypothetical protein